ncbi:hypothetical protein [Deinococcus altitudinis]|uniref:hypothetical protein n=1 Tax=Deinococcus altitudinis TaxID=468914 RepID=UPI0038922146
MTQNDQTWAEHLSEPQREVLRKLEEQGYTFALKRRRPDSDEGFVMDVTWNDSLSAQPVRTFLDGKVSESPQLVLLTYIVADASSQSLGMYFDDLAEVIEERSR